MIAFTICAKNYLAKALVLRETFLEHNKHDRFVIVVADMIGSRTELSLLSYALPEDAEVVFFQQIRNTLDMPRLEEMLVKYDVTEFCTAIKPFVFQYLFKTSGHPEGTDIVYLDPDMAVYHHFGVLKTFLEKYNIALTPHTLRPNDQATDDITLLAAGAYNLGFLALRRGESTGDLLNWWGNRLLDHCYKEPRPFFTDQKWADLIPCYFRGVGIFDHQGYNVARWNLHERKLTQRDGKWFVNEHYPLVLYHFSRVSLLEERLPPDLLLCEHCTAVANKHQSELAQLPYYYNSVPGTAIPIDTWRKRQKEGFGTSADYQILHPNRELLWAYTGQHVLPTFGLNVVGYLRHPNGVGQVARDFLHGLLGSGIPFSWTPLDEFAPDIPLSGEGELEYYRADDPIFDTTIFLANADQIEQVIKSHPHLRRKTNVGVFWWELEDHFPFENAFDQVDHVLTFSHFVESIMKANAPKRVGVHKLVYPLQKVEQWSSSTLIRHKMGLGDDDVLFGFNFDYLSCHERKNPEGLMAAFSMAFTPEDSSYLLLKVSNATAEQLNYLGKFAAKTKMREKIRIVSASLSRMHHVDLMGACDCYVSLHRSEGLGLGMMEAMAMGKPVIATMYGGNLEFMDKTNSYLVDYLHHTVQNGFKNYYPKGARWAEPLVGDAAEAMRSVYRNREEATRRGQEAKRSLYRQFRSDVFHRQIRSLVNSWCQ